MGPEGTVVEVRGAYKRFAASQKPILKGLNMTVSNKSIYGLLGPSGCGKTTLLSCIVGRKLLDSGTIRLGVTRRSQIGYMPQEVALFKELTIRETFYFYGKVFGLGSRLLDERCEDLRRMLELPKLNRSVGSLSGGQQRRVSLAVTLLHNPKLLILDEPTVGLDPLLCQCIWDYLLKLVNFEDKAVIITTHYIEEARQTHTIGLMREGVLLSEASPSHLMASTNSLFLEEAFLILSTRQQEVLNYQEQKCVDYDYPVTKKNCSASPLPNGNLFNRHRFTAQLIKNAYWAQRNIPLMAFLLLLPALQTFLFCNSVGYMPRGLAVAVVSDELSAVAGGGPTSLHELCSRLARNTTYNEALQCHLPDYFACRFADKLTDRLDVVLYDSIEMAKYDVRKHKVWSVIYLTGNFTDSFIERLSTGLYTDELTLDQSIISVWMDMADFIIGSQMKRDISNSMIKFVQDVLELCGLSKGLAEIPVRFNDAIFGQNPDCTNDEPVFRYNGIPGFMCSFVFFFTLTFTSGAIMMEKMVGIQERSLVAGMTRLEIIAAHLVIQVILMFAQKTVMILMIYTFFTSPLIGDIKLLIAVLISVEMVGICYGFMLTEIFKTDKLMTYSEIGTVISLLLITGVIWPLEGAHTLLRSWIRGLPVVAAVQSYNGVSVKGYGLSHPTVYMGFVSSAFWCTAFSLIAYYLARRSRT